MDTHFYRCWVFVIAAILVGVRSVAVEPPDGGLLPQPPLSPQEALQQFAIRPELQIELVAAEPQVIDPVAMAFDEHGRLWVVEMRDYPFGPQEGETPQSRIKLLEDHDGDGQYETAHTFADGLLFATGIQPWRGGVIVTLSGEIAWLADTDGDRRADVRQKWFRGFAERNPQLRANDPTFWFDGNVYVAGGLHYGGKIVTAREAWQGASGAEPIDLRQGDFRFDPRTGRASAIAGGAQFGLAFDAFGNRFVCSNSRPIEHVVLEERHLIRNERTRLTQTNERVIADREDRSLYPLSRQQTTSYLHEGHFTAACGLLIYGGDALPDEFRGNAFICEPTASLVHREVLEPRGPTFAARAGRDGVEFLASRDSWFRPVFLSEGPDGALYVVDMYRAVIEHPEWFPDLENRSDLTAGNDRGRIWRITRRGPTSRSAHSAKRTDSELAASIASLEHRNAWHRLTAARLIFEQPHDNVSAPIRELAAGGSSPEARSTALTILDGLGAITADDLLAAIDDRDADVRRVALRLAERHVGQSKPLHRRVLQVALDPRADRSQLFAAMLSLGAVRAESLRPVVRLAARVAADDQWVRTAILSSPVQLRAADLDDLCRVFAGGGATLSEGRRILIDRVAEQIGLGGTDDQIGEVLSAETVAGEEISQVRLVGLVRGVSQRGAPFRTWIAAQPADLQRKWRRLLSEAAEKAADNAADDSTRLRAVELLEHGEFEQVIDTLRSLASKANDTAIRAAAIRAVANFDRPEAAEVLLGDFPHRGVGERRVVLEALLGGRIGASYLLDQLENQSVPMDLIDAGTRQRLLSHPRDDLRRRAEAAFDEHQATDRAAIIAAYRAALERPGDAAAGKDVFQRHCATCHRVGDAGTAVGPDVADNYNKTREQLLVNILDPNRTIESRYEAYVVVTRSGLTLQGLLENETAAAVTVRESEGRTTTVSRDELEEIRPTGVSFMPEGIDKDIDVTTMTNLLAFLKRWRELRP